MLQLLSFESRAKTKTTCHTVKYGIGPIAESWLECWIFLEERRGKLATGSGFKISIPAEILAKSEAGVHVT
ncbi:hypothetical protein SLA2020_368730 [Shorea laevis]